MLNNLIFQAIQSWLMVVGLQIATCRWARVTFSPKASFVVVSLWFVCVCVCVCVRVRARARVRVRVCVGEGFCQASVIQ